MKQKLLPGMLGALILVISFAYGHATFRCATLKPEVVAETILATPALHFAPLDFLKW